MIQIPSNCFNTRDETSSQDTQQHISGDFVQKEA